MSERRVCVVGSGRWGRNHVRTLDQLGVLGGVVDASPAVRAALSDEHPGLQTFATVEQSLDAGFDGYTVATPAETHVAVARTLLQAGRHVLVEKPIALSAAEARDLARLADASGLALMVGHLMLFHPAVRAMQRCVDDGRLGELRFLQSSRLNLGTVRSEEDVLWSFAPHDLSVLLQLAGGAPTTVRAQGGSWLQPGLHDTVFVELGWAGGALGQVHVSWLHPVRERRMVVVGSKGMLTWDDTGPDTRVWLHDKGYDPIDGALRMRSGDPVEVPWEPAQPLTEELRAFVAALDGTPVTTAGPDNAIEVVDVLERASAALQESQ